MLISEGLGASPEGEPPIHSEGGSAMAFLRQWVNSLEGVWESVLRSAGAFLPGVQKSG